MARLTTASLDEFAKEIAALEAAEATILSTEEMDRYSGGRYGAYTSLGTSQSDHQAHALAGLEHDLLSTAIETQEKIGGLPSSYYPPHQAAGVMREPYDDVRPLDPLYGDPIGVDEFEFEWNAGIWSGGNVEGKGFIPSIKDEASGGLLDDEVGGSGGFSGYGNNTNRGKKKSPQPIAFPDSILSQLNDTEREIIKRNGLMLIVDPNHIYPGSYQNKVITIKNLDDIDVLHHELVHAVQDEKDMDSPKSRGNMEYQARVVADLLNIQRHNGYGIGGIGEFIHDDDKSKEYFRWIHECFDEKNKLNIGKFQAHVTYYFEYYKANPKLNKMQLGKVNPNYNWNWELILRSMGVNF